MEKLLEECGLKWSGKEEESCFTLVVSQECKDLIKSTPLENIVRNFPDFKKDLFDCLFSDKGRINILNRKKLLKKLEWTGLLTTLPEDFLQQMKIVYSSSLKHFVLEKPKEEILNYLKTSPSAEKFCGVLVPGYEMKKGILPISTQEELEEKIEEIIKGDLTPLVQKRINKIVDEQMFPLIVEKIEKTE